MPQIFRAYNPKVDFKFAVNYQATGPLTGSRQCQIQVATDLIHRKVWAIIESTNATFALNFDLVALLSGREVYRQKVASFYSAGGAGKAWYSGFNGGATNIGTGPEQIFVKIANTSLYALSPWRWNLACDTIYLDCVEVSAGGLIDAYLFCMSQAGI